MGARYLEMNERQKSGTRSFNPNDCFFVQMTFCLSTNAITLAYKAAKLLPRKGNRRRLIRISICKYGGRTWARTKDPLIKSQLLYQLSYASIPAW